MASTYRQAPWKSDSLEKAGEQTCRDGVLLQSLGAFDFAEVTNISEKNMVRGNAS